jgi:hypothetical protein
VPEGALPLTGCADRPKYLCRSFAKTESIGTELANAVSAAPGNMTPATVTQLSVHREDFFTRLTNIGFRVLIADGDIGWKPPLLAPFFGSQITRGDVIKTQLAYVDFGGVGILFNPGELPPELVIGLSLWAGIRPGTGRARRAL